MSGGERYLLHHLGDVLVELRHPQRVVHLVEVSEQRAFFVLLDLEVGAHLLEGVRGIEPVVVHQLPGHVGRDRPVYVLVQLDFWELAQALLVVG